jgi:hypothetical protein
MPDTFRELSGRKLIGTAVVTALAIACAVAIVVVTRGHARSEAAEEAREHAELVAEGRLESERPDFDRVYVDARPVHGVDGAATRLAFAPVAPAAIGAPKSVYVHGSVQNKSRQGMALVYDDASYGRFVVTEERVEMTQAYLETLPDRCHAADLCEGTWKLITLRDGTRALLVAGPGSTSVAWLRGKTRIFILGPPDSFTIDEAVAVATKFAAAS